MPGMDGIELLNHVRRTKPAVPVIVLTAFGTVQTAVEAMKAGANDFLVKPFSHQALDEVLSKHVGSGFSQRSGSTDSGEIITRNPAMRSLLDQAAQAARQIRTRAERNDFAR
jgi:DNA-binding NtrC family response regulator